MKSQSNSVIFKKDSIIILYHGEQITHAELDERYGDYTAPYAVMTRGSDRIPQEDFQYEDGACTRCVGALANSKPRENQNNARLRTKGKPG